MKIVSLVLVLCLLATMVWAGAFDAVDKEAEDVALFIRKMLGGNSYEKLILERYPAATFEWGGRLHSSEEGSATYILYCEIKQPRKEPVYLFYEFKFSNINDNPILMKKYGLVY